MHYNPAEIEPKWQAFWEKNKVFAAKTDPSKKKFYGLIEFPYPSGTGLHVGHPRSYTAMDVICRQKRMDGYNVLYPIGFDAFGLPTENFAIKTGRAPAEVTEENIATFTRQLKSLGFGFDWDRVVDTTDPAYYKWTQWIFLKLFEHGFAYKKNQPINWCLSCKIGLANEEVLDGKCERCGGAVEKRDKEQWMLAITKYADKLLSGLDTVDYIPQAKAQQQNWIGRSEGAEIDFKIENSELKITVFTTRPDTLFGATYMVLAPEHEAVSRLKSQISNLDEVEVYINETKKKTDLERSAEGREKTGVELKGVKAVNPVNGEQIPLFIADYVLGGYGTGAIMAVPAHDERDFEFAKKYNLPIKQVVAPYFVNDLHDDVETLWGRHAVDMIIEHPDGKQFLLQKEGAEHVHFVGGGIDAGEDLLESVKREVIEETGYIHFEVVEQLDNTVGAIGFRHTKNKNQEGYSTFFHIKLNDEEKVPSEVEEGKHEIEWVKKEDVISRITTAWPHHKAGWEMFIGSRCFSGDGKIIHSDFLDGLTTTEAKEKMIQHLEEKNIGKRKVQFKLRDWVFSRQRYWGEPIPLVFCENCRETNNPKSAGEKQNPGWIPLSENQLPLELPKVEKYQPTDNGESPLSTVSQWVEVACPRCGGQARRETDTMPNWAGSSWYFLRYADPHNSESFFSISPFVRRSAIVPTDKDLRYFNAFKTIYSDFESKGIKIWTVNRFLLNGLNGALWMPLRTVAFMAYEQDLLHISEYLESNGYQKTAEEKWGYEFFKDDVRVEVVPIFLDEKGLYGFTSKMARQDLNLSDLPDGCFGSLFGFSYRTVSPSYNLSHYEYIDEHEKRDGHGDQEKIDFLREWIAGMNPALQYWMGVDWYNGGMEHTVLHLLYSRFWNQFLYDIGVVPVSEPYRRRTSHGMILAKGGEKMSKSKGNVVNPDDIVREYGADTLRLYILFMGPFDQAAEWDTNGIKGVRRFLDKLAALVDKVSDSVVASAEVEKNLHRLIKKITMDISSMQFNTAVAKMMEFVNFLQKESSVPRSVFLDFIKLTSPFLPHLAEELFEKCGGRSSVSMAAWPKFSEEKIKDELVKVAVQVNGKLRAELMVEPDMPEDKIVEIAIDQENVKKWLDNASPKKVIYVPGRILNLVI